MAIKYWDYILGDDTTAMDLPGHLRHSILLHKCKEQMVKFGCWQGNFTFAECLLTQDK